MGGGWSQQPIPSDFDLLFTQGYIEGSISLFYQSHGISLTIMVVECVDKIVFEIMLMSVVDLLVFY